MEKDFTLKRGKERKIFKKKEKKRKKNKNVTKKKRSFKGKT